MPTPTAHSLPLPRILATALAPAVWGTTYIVTTHLLPAGHPVFAAWMRTLPPGLIALALSRQLPSGVWWWRSLVLGGLNMAAFFPLLFVAAQHLPGGAAATLGAVQPILITLLAVILLREPLSLWRLGWGVAGVVGVALVVLGPGAAMDMRGVAAGLGSALVAAIGIVLTKKLRLPDDVPTMALVGWQLTAGGLLLTIPALAVETAPPDIAARGWLGYAWLALPGALLAYHLWFTGIRQLPVTSTSLLGLLSPLVATTLGALIAHERLSAPQLVGFTICLAAMTFGQRTAPSTRKTHS